MKTLLLGGTSEARELISQLSGSQFALIYSVKGKIDPTALPCPVISGGFKQYAGDSVRGLIQYIKQQNIELIIDATHPYAENISLHAAQARKKLNIHLIRLARQPWQKTTEDQWLIAESYRHIAQLMSQYRRPFITLGYSSAALVEAMTTKCRYLIRQIKAPKQIHSNSQYIFARGPFSIAAEMALMKQHKTDVLISKNSGGQSSFNKILAARQLKIPVIMLKRPEADIADNVPISRDIQSCVEQCLHLLKTH